MKEITFKEKELFLHAVNNFIVSLIQKYKNNDHHKKLTQLT